MKAFIAFAVVLGIVCVCSADRILPVFEVDLDQPPRQRWQPVYKQLLQDKIFAGTVNVLIHKGYESLHANGCDDKCVARVNNAFKVRFPEYYQEILGIADLLQPLSVTPEMLVMEQARYEWTVLGLDVPQSEKERMMRIIAGEKAVAAKAKAEAAKKELPVDELQIPVRGAGCTSALVCGKDGEVLHGRNLDWFGAPNFAATMFRVNFMRNGKVLYQSEQLPGLVGVLTIARPGAFTMSLNARLELKNPTWEQVFNCFDAIPMQPLMTAYRYWAENFENYDNLVANMTRAPTCSPYFGIVAGLDGKGMRTQHKLPEVYEDYKAIVDKEELQCTDNLWYLAECNSDFDVPATKDADVRRMLVMNEMKGENRTYSTTPVGLFHAMTVPLVKNEKSVHTTIMSPKEGEIFTVAYDK